MLVHAELAVLKGWPHTLRSARTEWDGTYKHGPVSLHRALCHWDSVLPQSASLSFSYRVTSSNTLLWSLKSKELQHYLITMYILKISSRVQSHFWGKIQTVDRLQFYMRSMPHGCSARERALLVKHNKANQCAINEMQNDSRSEILCCRPQVL